MATRDLLNRTRTQAAALSHQVAEGESVVHAIIAGALTLAIALLMIAGWPHGGTVNPESKQIRASAAPGPASILFGEPTAAYRANVDLRSGGFTHSRTDLFVAGALPINFTRVYRGRDDHSYALGIGTSHTYDIVLAHDSDGGNAVYLATPDGNRVKFNEVAAGSDHQDLLYVHPDADGRTKTRGCFSTATARTCDSAMARRWCSRPHRKALRPI